MGVFLSAFTPVFPVEVLFNIYMEITEDSIKMCIKKAFDLLLELDFEFATQAFEEILSFDESHSVLSFEDRNLIKEGLGITLLNSPETQDRGLDLIHCVYKDLSSAHGKYHCDTIAALHSLGCAYRACSMMGEACGIFADEIALLENQNREDELEKAKESYWEISHYLQR